MIVTIHDSKAIYEGRPIVKATCSACQREYWATEAFVCAVQDGREESLCGYCDNSHNDYDDKNEREG